MTSEKSGENAKPWSERMGLVPMELVAQLLAAAFTVGGGTYYPNVINIWISAWWGRIANGRSRRMREVLRKIWIPGMLPRKMHKQKGGGDIPVYSREDSINRVGRYAREGNDVF